MAQDPTKPSKATPATLLSHRRPGVRMGASAIRSSSPPVRIVGTSRRYRGGYCVNV
jgi:hypothetical protein